MASSKALIVSSLLLISSSLFLFVLQADDSLMVNNGDHEFDISLSQADDDNIDCDSACHVRCSKASRHKMCIRECRTCCSRCHCVPPGTSGNEDVCPCYANMTTHGGRHKCP